MQSSRRHRQALVAFNKSDVKGFKEFSEEKNSCRIRAAFGFSGSAIGTARLQLKYVFEEGRTVVWSERLLVNTHVAFLISKLMPAWKILSIMLAAS